MKPAHRNAYNRLDAYLDKVVRPAGAGDIPGVHHPGFFRHRHPARLAWTGLGGYSRRREFRTQLRRRPAGAAMTGLLIILGFATLVTAAICFVLSGR